MSTQTTTTQAASGAEVLERVRHLKRGTEYEVLDRKARLQTDKPLSDDAEVVVYRSTSGMTWVRPVSEMNDGRFETITTAPQPAGAERVDLGSYAPALIHYQDDDRLEYVSSDVATVTRHLGAGFAILLDMKTREPVGFYIEQASKIVPASLPAALGSGEGTAGATLTGQATQQSPSPAVSALAGECPSRGSAATVEQIPIIRDALIQARGALHLDAMTDEAGKPYGTTSVAQEAISVALAILDAAPNSEAAR